MEAIRKPAEIVEAKIKATLDEICDWHRLEYSSRAGDASNIVGD